MSKLREPIDRVVEIERLAALEPIDYEAARTDAAKLLGFRVRVLDEVVANKRRALGLDNGEIDDGQGQAVKIPDVPRWHEPVDGDQIATMLAAAVKTYAVVPDSRCRCDFDVGLAYLGCEQVYHVAALGNHITHQRLRQDHNPASSE